MAIAEITQLRSVDRAFRPMTAEIEAEAPSPVSLRVLICDDQPLMQSILTRVLQRQGHEVHVASDGKSAWEMMKLTYYPIVICDWEMPEMDGLDLCRKMRKEIIWSEYSYFLLLTGRGRQDDYLAGLDAGADDFLIKPVEPKVLCARLKGAQRVIRLQQDLGRRNALLAGANQSIATAYRHLQEDLSAAAKLQAQMLPPPQCYFGQIEGESLLTASSFVSGDVVNCFAIPGREAVGFYALDVAGHGVRAALSSFMLAKQMRPDIFWPQESKQPELAAMLADLNRTHQSGIETADYFTMAAGVIDCRTRTLFLALAGHPQPILKIPGAPSRPCGEPGLPIGMIPEAFYQQISISFPAGARLLLYSDGVTECASPSNALFGVSNLTLLVDEAAAMPLAALLQRIEARLIQWNGRGLFDDDISMLALASLPV